MQFRTTATTYSDQLGRFFKKWVIANFQLLVVAPQQKENTKFFEKLNLELPPLPVEVVPRPNIFTAGVVSVPLSFDILNTPIKLQYLRW